MAGSKSKQLPGPAGADGGSDAAKFCHHAPGPPNPPRIVRPPMQESEELFRNMVDHTPLMLWMTDASGAYVHLNQSWFAFTGSTLGESYGLGWTRAVHPDDRARVREDFLEAVGAAQPFQLEYRIRRADGEYRWVIDAGAPRLDSAGELLGFVGSLLDISDRKRTEMIVAGQNRPAAIAIERRRAEQAAQAAEQQLRVVTDSAPVMLTQFDTRRRLTFANRAYLERRGLEWPEVAGRALEEIIDAETYRSVRPQVERVLAGVRVDFELEVSFPRIGARWLSVSYVPDRDMDGTVHGWTSAIVDITENRRADAATRQLAAIVEYSDDAIISKDLDGRITSWNGGAERLFGYPVAEAVNQSMQMLVPPDRVAEEEAMIARIRRGEHVDHTETVRRCKDGRIVDVDISISPLLDAGGATIGASIIARDITGRKRQEAAFRQAQEAIRQGEARYRERSQTLETLNRVGNTLVAELDLGKIVQTVTDAGRDISGAAFGAFRFHPRLEFDSDGSALNRLSGMTGEAYDRSPLPRQAPLLEATFRGEGVLRIADVTSDPRYVPSSARSGPTPADAAVRSWLSVPVVSRSGDVLGGLFFGHPNPGMFGEASESLLTGLAAQAAIAIDNANLYAALQHELTQQKRSDAALRVSERQLRLVTDHAPVFLVLVDRDHRYTFVNRPYAQRYGREPLDVIGLRMPELIGERAYDVVRHHVEAGFTSERADYEVEVPYEMLGSRWMHVLYVAERNADGEVVGLLAVMNDITRRKQVEREVEITRDRALAASRAKDDFLAALSHELRTPLNPVLLLASEGAADAGLAPEVRATFATIRNNVELEARLIDDLLDLTRIARGKLLLDRRAQDAHDVLRAALATVRDEIAEKRIDVVLDLAAEPPEVFGDAVRLQQIFWNVLKNAVKFTPLEGRITIETRSTPDAGTMTIRIVDTGIGMTPAELGRVFDAFVQGEHADSGAHRFGGVGLGLAISKMLIEQHQGRIRAESAGRDQGATFTIELPLAASPRPADPEPGPGRSRLSPAPATPPTAVAPAGFRPRGRVLLVEDHEPTRHTLAHLLSRREFEVTSAATLEEARDLAVRVPFDLLISDIGLPDGSGYDLMAELRARQSIKGIALSGYGMDEDVARSQQAGFSRHLTKPIRVELLDSALEDVGRQEGG